MQAVEYLYQKMFVFIFDPERNEIFKLFFNGNMEFQLYFNNFSLQRKMCFTGEHVSGSNCLKV